MSLFAALTVSFTSCAFAQEKRTVVNIETSLGNIKVELNESAAPISVKNFLSYVDDKFYDGTIFHRVISDFMIQG
ncbi:peptidyl-prolyl cis-trans isomerase, partial [bacterium]|nr:peptidyl-prolyl cis-trans isomerase [bacterium]